MHIFWRTLTLPLQFPGHWIRLRSPLLQKDGTRIIGEVDAPLRTQGFFQDTVEALDLIRSSDERRYRRIVRVSRIIVSRPLPFLAQYQSFKTCVIDYPYLAQKYPARKQRIALLCCILIHEATHGELERKGFGYTRATFLRHERLCCLEEMRFAKRITGFYPNAERCASAHDSKQPYIHGPRQMLNNFRKHWRRLRKSRGDAESKS